MTAHSSSGRPATVAFVPPAASTRPILIVGAPRSGTTLLATMLNAHSDIFVANETKLLIDCLPASHTHIDISSAKLEEEAAARGLMMVPDTASSDVVRSAGDVPARMRRLFERAAAQQGKRRWGEKTAVAYRRLGDITRAFPDGCFIGLERDVAAVAASYERINPTWGAAGGVLHWLEFRRAIARQGPDFNFLLVRYEQLVSDTEATLRRVCEFVGEPFDPVMLEHHKTERAKALSRSPEFSGAASAVYAATGRAEPVPLPGWLLDGARRYAVRLDAARADISPPAWYRGIDMFVKLRLVVREMRQNGGFATVRKILKAQRLKLIGSA